MCTYALSLNPVLSLLHLTRVVMCWTSTFGEFSSNLTYIISKIELQKIILIIESICLIFSML